MSIRRHAIIKYARICRRCRKWKIKTKFSFSSINRITCTLWQADLKYEGLEFFMQIILFPISNF